MGFSHVGKMVWGWLLNRRARWSLGIIFSLSVVAMIILLCSLGRINNADILKAAYAIPDGGGYCALTETGVPNPVIHRGITIEKASKGGTYCCGFTFAIAMRVAEQRGLLANKEPYEIARAQREWYGASKISAERELVLAMTNLGIGREVAPEDARPGDFVTFQRVRGAGHSVIFLDWIRRDDVIVGFRYRSSQHSTGGIGDCNEYFTTSGYTVATVNPKRFYVGRMNSN